MKAPSLKNMPNGAHPIWSLIRLFLLMTALCVVLYLEAENFDGTELRSIVWVFLAAAGIEGAIHAGTKAMKEK